MRKGTVSAALLITALLVLNFDTHGQSAPAMSLTPDRSAARPMVPKDLFNLRRYGIKSQSPDGKLFAIEIFRWAPGAWRESGDLFSTGINQRAELWVVSRNGNERGRLTPSDPVGLSQWNPLWSPNSSRLAFLSNEDRDNVFLKIWDRSTRKARLLTKAPVDVNALISMGSTTETPNPMLWLDETHLLTVLLPEGSRSHSLDESSKSAMVACTGVRDAAAGLKPTGVVASSPPGEADTVPMLRATLVIFDVSSGLSRTLGEVPAWEARVAQRYVVVSHNAAWAAVVSAIPPRWIDPLAPPSARQAEWTNLGIVSLSQHGPRGVHWVDGVQPELTTGGFNVVIDWRADDSLFAVAAQDPQADKPVYVTAVDPHTTTSSSVAVLDSQALGLGGRPVEITNIAWFRDNTPLVRVRVPAANSSTFRNAWFATTGGQAAPVNTEEDAWIKEKFRRNDSDLSSSVHTTETGRLYVSGENEGEKTILPELNPQIRDLAPPRSIDVEYQSRRGERLHADLLLPYGYFPGKRYPTVVWVYGGDIRTGKEPPASLDDNSAYNLMLLSGHGYAVLIPSMPLSAEGASGDPMQEFNDGVDPAVDRAAESGIVDPERIAVMGVSYGGYSVFGLLAETHRYRAGIALVGISNLSSWYGQFDRRFSYSDPSYAAAIGPWSLEWAQGRMGVPVWVDPGRYVRNSPVFAANRISAPVLIFSGDLDFLSIQSDEMFTALNRQGKRAEYVRYLGEEHVFASPANILDMWQRIFTWLDRYVRNSEGSGH